MREQVVEVSELPAPAPGDSALLLLADDDHLAISYRIRERDVGEAAKVGADADSPLADGPRVIVAFTGVLLHRCGYPNDEAIEGHQLGGRGLECYSAMEVLHSAWPRELERQNRIHPHAQEGEFGHLRHFVITFHDSTFECLAAGFAARPSCEAGQAQVAEMATVLSDLGGA